MKDKFQVILTVGIDNPFITPSYNQKNIFIKEVFKKGFGILAEVIDRNQNIGEVYIDRFSIVNFEKVYKYLFLNKGESVDNLED